MNPQVVEDVTERSRFELRLEGGTAFLDYLYHDGVWSLTHAEVPPAMRGRGVAAQLTAGALDWVRQRGEKVVPRCPYVAAFIDRHPQYRSLLA